MRCHARLLSVVSMVMAVALTGPSATAETTLKPVPNSTGGNQLNPVPNSTGGNTLNPVPNSTGHTIVLKPGQVKPPQQQQLTIQSTYHAGKPSAPKPAKPTPSTTTAIQPGQATGHPTCGGIVGGKPQKPCGIMAATYHGKPVPACPAGSFFDLGRWECWSCPAGFARAASLDAVDSERACLRPKRGVTKFGRATPKGLVCPRGSFYDPIRGGECRACPPGYKRTVFHVDWDNACQKGGVFGPVARASHVKKAACAPGEIQDFLRNPTHGGECWRCPTGWARTVFPVNGDKACQRSAFFEYARARLVKKLGCPAGQFWSPLQVGSCWSCPASYVPTLGDLKKPACRARTIVWKTNPYPEPGLFGLDSAGRVVLDLVTHHPEVIEAVIASVAKKAKIPLAQARREAWLRIASKPWESPVLEAAVFTRVLVALAAPKKASGAEHALTRSFAKYMRERQIYIARDALAAYDAWYRANRYWKAKRDKALNSPSSLFYHGTVPPDFTSIVKLGTIGRTAAGVAVAGVIALTLANKAVFEKIFPFTLKIVHERALKAAVLAGFEAAEAGAKATAAVAARLVGKGLLSFVKGAFAGPFAALTVGQILATLAEIRFDAINDARPKLLNALATAKRPFSLPRLAESSEGLGRISAYWNVAMLGKRRPSPAVAARILGLGMQKMVKAVASAASASHAPGHWARVKGSLATIAVGSARQVWGINRAGTIFRWTGRGWQPIRAKSVARPQNLGVGTDGMVWATTTNHRVMRFLAGRLPAGRWSAVGGSLDEVSVGSTKHIWGVNRADDIFRWDRGRWRHVAGKLAHIGVGADGAVWGTNARHEVFRREGSRWKVIKGSLGEIAVGSAKHVWGLDSGGAVWRWTGTAWQRMPGKLLHIGVGADGAVWGTNAKHEILRWRPAGALPHGW